MKKYKYLDKIGMPRKLQGTNFTKDRKKFKKQRKKYGFDQRETYNLDQQFIQWIYCRLKMYDKINIIDTSYHKFNWKGEEITLQQAMDMIMKAAKKYLKAYSRDNGFYCGEEQDILLHEFCDLMPLWGEILPFMWW